MPTTKYAQPKFAEDKKVKFQSRRHKIYVEKIPVFQF